jgi:hypothetical protein
MRDMETADTVMAFPRTRLYLCVREFGTEVLIAIHRGTTVWEVLVLAHPELGSHDWVVLSAEESALRLKIVSKYIGSPWCETSDLRMGGCVGLNGISTHR